MQRVVVLFATLAALLAGCTLGPDYQRPAVPVPAQHRDAEPPAPGREAASLADVQWFALFQDERLQALVSTALENNYDVRIAAARVLEAAAQLGVTRSFLLPTIDGTAAVGRERISQENFIPLAPGVSPAGNFFSLGLALTWEVDVWGRIRRQTEAARADLLAAEWARRAVLVTVISQVASAYFALRELDDELQIAQRTLTSRQQSLRLTQLRLEHGASTRLDVRQAENLLYTAAATIPLVERQIGQTENAISLLLAQPPGDILRGRALTEQPIPPEIPAGLPAALLERRPDIRASEEALVSANAQIGAAKALYFPRISITGLLGIESADLDNFVKASARTSSIAAQALQPIFNYGRVRSINEATQASYLRLLTQYEQTIQTAFREVSDALIGYHKSREQRIQQELLVGALQDRVSLANQRFFGGLDSYLQVLDAERDLFDAELNLARLQRDERLNIVGLYRALGGGWESATATADVRAGSAALVKPAAGQ
jgi:outer membrane protein, multidrug efflux system